MRRRRRRRRRGGGGKTGETETGEDDCLRSMMMIWRTEEVMTILNIPLTTHETDWFVLMTLPHSTNDQQSVN